MKIVRVLLALLVLAVLLYLVGSKELLTTLALLTPGYIALLLIFSVLLIWVSCLKWRLFIRAGGNDASMGRLMALYTVGYFFNTFMPSTVGGDLMRSYHLGRHLDSQQDAFVATFLERFTGVLAMVILGVVFVLSGADATAGLSAAILSVGALTMVPTLACFSERFGALIFAIVERILAVLGEHKPLVTLRRLLGKVDAGLAIARSNKRLLVHSLLLSLVFHTLTVINTYIAARAIGWEEPNFSGMFVVVPLVLLISMAPLTPNGLGIQEGAFLFLLKRIGAAEAQGFAVGIVLRAKAILLAVVGWGIWWYLRGEASRRKQVEPEEALI